MRLVFFAGSLIALSGCVQSRIAAELRTYGLDAQRADCVGSELSSRLSIAQIKTLAAAVRDTPSLRGKGVNEVKASDLASVAARVGDPQTIVVTAQAALKCNLI